jgi:UDP-glucose 4-epimerase
MKGRRILVTGGSGFIGGFTLETLSKLGAEVVCFARRLPDTIIAPATFIRGDVTDAEGFISACQAQAIDTIVHLAGYGTTMLQSHPELGVRVNIMGMSNVLEAARILGLKVVFTSSIAVYGQITLSEAGSATEEAQLKPITVYGAGKLLCEKLGQAYAQNYDLKFIALRVTAVYGFTDLARRGVEHPTFSDHARRLIELPLAGQPVVVEKGGRQSCDFVYVKDVARAIANACVAEHLKHDVFNIGSGEVRTLRDFAETVTRYEPEADMRVGETPNPAYPFMGPVDISRAIEELAYKPTPYADCIEDYVKSIRARETS